MRRLDIEALFRHSIEPAGFIFVARELQCVQNAVKIYDANFKVCIGWRTRNRQPFFGQRMNLPEVSFDPRTTNVLTRLRSRIASKRL
jgi:hypothetical protein